jgi:cell division protein FtsI/penicillin-binding protein 2
MKFLFKINPKKYDSWSIFIQIATFVLAGIIILKLIFIQMIQGPELKEKASQNRRSDRDFSFRGEIVDRNGIRLAGDSTSYDIYAHPQFYEKDKGPEIMAPILAKYLKQPEWLLKEKLSRVEDSTIYIAKNIDTQTVDKGIRPEVTKAKIRGLDFYKKTKRVYPQGNLASHILGYVNLDANISAGVERTGHTSLATVPDLIPVEYDGRGNVIYDFDTDPEQIIAPPKGSKLVLTIDSAIQHVSEIELAKMIAKTQADKGTVIVLNPKNGEILRFIQVMTLINIINTTFL